MADTNISNWSAFWLYVSQTFYNKVLQNATRNDFENFLQKILGIPSSFWEIVLLILLFLVVCVAILIVLKIIAAIGTIVSKIIQPISIPESLQPICTLASEGLRAFCTLASESLPPICTLASEVLKHACILMPVMLVTLTLVLVVLSNFTPIDVDKYFSKFIDFCFTPYKTPEQSMPPPLVNGY
ncbi:hypothetical protein BTUL_0144g00210 [Botrytis tulipae]|uniref:Uncharacterized protein n=1 Tax=Botrytis tulipae TaxID=87230 RepID=A0A4Z1EMB9_9HELO|nr:hypothetical protein BTUL_0144g00210 [Botrytis tulipae]